MTNLERDSGQDLAEIDRELLRWALRRRELAGGAATSDGGAPERWETVVEGLPLDSRQAETLLREIVAFSARPQRMTRVAYLGPEDSYSHLAAIQRFGESADLAPVATIAAVFEEVSAGRCEFGVAPLENSTDGRVVDTLDMFVRVPLKICGETPLPIRHCLVGRGPRSGVRRVLSKPQAISQCRQWLASSLPTAAVEPASSTSDAAAQAAADPSVAAIASRNAASRYGLELLAEDIQDAANNVTRFAVLGRSPAARTGRDKTAVMFQTPHRPGALVEAMLIFQRQGLNLTWIESFPCRERSNEYLFFVEVQGHQDDEAVATATSELGLQALRMEILGSYPVNPA